MIVYKLKLVFRMMHCKQVKVKYIYGIIFKMSCNTLVGLLMVITRQHRDVLLTYHNELWHIADSKRAKVLKFITSLNSLSPFLFYYLQSTIEMFLFPLYPDTQP